MPETELKLFKRCVEFQPLEEIKNVPPGIRGIYPLLRWRPRVKQFDVVYVGMARTGVRVRLRSHAQSKSKPDLWTHFSMFEVFDNVRGEEIQKLEGLLRHYLSEGLPRKPAERAAGLCQAISRALKRLP